MSKGWICVLGLLLLVSAGGCHPKKGGEDGGPDVVDGGDAGPVDAGDGDGGDAGPVDAGAPCLSNCVGRECGDDSCGGTCGDCSSLAAPFCDELYGHCVETCTPVCAGKNCGDDGCGGSCGSCVGTLGCSSVGVCVPPTWSCDPQHYAAGDLCDCGCGAPDPDCGDDSLPLSGCSQTETCGVAGQCVPIAPASWSCLASQYGARDACDCGCGAVDPDCAVAGLPLRGCNGRDASCDGAGSCVCTPDCGAKVCGDDGCGGSCGSCADPLKNLCHVGQCVSACDPLPLRCDFAECGSDACGGSCGTCTPGTNCLDGACLTVEVRDPLSCHGRCGNLNPAGCSCQADCVGKGTCCPDYPTTCGTCLPSCGSRVCGADGCGGSCGQCGSGAVCSAGVCITGCQPSCAGRQCGDDGCGGQCGTCGAAESCQWTGKCVPDTWFCESSAYGDGTACHCGCGALDPNCGSASISFGCSSITVSCSSQGLCPDPSCASDAECGTGRLCSGTYYQGNARFAGSCGASVGGKNAGELCDFGEACATGVCAQGLCRRYCATDSDCGGQELCVAMVQKTLGGAITGFVSVCELLPGHFGSCAAQADCPQQACVALLQPQTLIPGYTCANTPRALGAACDASPCPLGQLCAAVPVGKVCTLPCPAGASDCPNGWHCGSKTYASRSFDLSSVAPVVPVCVPN